MGKPTPGRRIRDFSQTGPSKGKAPFVKSGPTEIPDILIEYVAQTEQICEPPRKRQKLMQEPNPSTTSVPTEKPLDYIIVADSVWETKCAGSKLKGLESPMERTNIKLFAPKEAYARDFFEILDDKKRTIYRNGFPADDNDFKLAVEVDQETSKWGRSGPGRSWTEFGVRLLRRGVDDYIQVFFTVKWNVTRSPYDVPRIITKPLAITSLLKYFPDPNITCSDVWSLQDFYQSVHTPSKEDKSAQTLQTLELEAKLFPFQKRAVQWLLRREGVEWSSSNNRVEDTLATNNSDLPISFISGNDARGQPCFISHLFGIVTLDAAPFDIRNQSLRGGILAEEMGLGKTLEIISLVTLHRRTFQSATVFDVFIGDNVRPTSSTLIISPPSILQQWLSEISRHAPHLKVIHYEGIKEYNQMSPNELVDLLASSDIVVSTYSILAAEIHYTQLNPEKSLRRESKYPRPKSPLMQLSWWRVCIDEAQMIESGVSNAAIVARMIPRINAWAVTGTPVRKDVNDLLGLLIFLRCEPFASTKHVWSALISGHKYNFRKIFSQLALRHSKRSVREELRLPAQRRYVITMPFTPIEEQHYQELFNQMCEESGVDAEGSPLTDNWTPESVSDVMRKWLVRLRQIALHPEIGGKNRRAVGNIVGPLRTVNQVLESMVENTDQSIRTDQRLMLVSKLRRGQLFENSPRVMEALVIWEEVAGEALAIVEECRQQLSREHAGIIEIGSASGKASQSVSDADEEQEE
jgi:E3 ubiquitin-protein ligase SHPRH